MGVFSSWQSAMSGAASIIANLVGQDIVARSISLTQTTGNIAVQLVTGARLKLGGGTNDFLTSDGSNTITAAGTFSSPTIVFTSSLGSGPGAIMATANVTAGDSDFRGNVANGASSVALAFGNTTALTTAGAQIAAFYSDLFSTRVFAIDQAGKLTAMPTTDSSGTPGNATANTPTGKAAIAIGAATIVISNTLVTANSRIFISPRARDTTGLLPTVTAQSAGTSFTVTTSANCTAALPFDWWVIN